MITIHNAFTFSHILDLKYVFLADLVNSRPNLTNPNIGQRLFAWDFFFFSRWRYGAILLIPRCPVGKLDGNCLTEMEKQSARVSKSEVLIARYHDKITCLQMLWRELQGFTSPFYHLYKKRTLLGKHHIWNLNFQIFKPYYIRAVYCHSTKKWPKMTRIKRLEQSFVPILKYHCLWTCKKPKQTIHSPHTSLSCG